MKTDKVDMLHGKIIPALISFTIPILLSSLLQLLYNAADIIVVGQFAGKEAVGAVGATTSLIHLITNLFIGLSVGVNVVVGQHIGAGEEKQVPVIVNNALILSIVSGGLVTLVGVCLSKQMLLLTQIPDNIIPFASKYLFITFLGAPALMAYNFCAAALRAYGDTKRPLIYLAVSGLVNIVLNVLFVAGFHMDVDGVALATIISQYIAAIMVVVTLLKEKGCCRIDLKNMKFSIEKTLQIIKTGVPAGIYSIMFSLANVVIQSGANSFDSDIVVSGVAAAASLEGFIYTGMNSVAVATTSFVSQNYGARRFDRIKKTVGSSLLLGCAVWVVMSTAFFLLQDFLYALYLPNDPAAIEYGIQRTNIIITTYFMVTFMDVATGAIRGMGRSALTSVISLLGTCGIRVGWIFLVFYPVKEFLSVKASLSVLYSVYPISWAITIMCLYVSYFLIIKKEIKKTS